MGLTRYRQSAAEHCEVEGGSGQRVGREGEGERCVEGVLEEGEGEGWDVAPDPGLRIHPSRQCQQAVE